MAQAAYDRLEESVKKTCYLSRGGIVFNKIMPQRNLDALIDFEVRDDDVYVITYPKSGTTWMQHIMSLILGDGDFDKVKEKHVFNRAPFLEVSQKIKVDGAETEVGVYEYANKMESPRFMKTQLPPSYLPRQLLEKKPKIVYVARNPKDLAVSYYHFCMLAPILPQYHSWAHFFEDFCNDMATRGSWFDHNLFWWRKRDEKNVFFVKYEDMKEDLRSVVTQVCRFLGKDLNDDVIDAITQNSSFGAMKADPTSNPDFLHRSAAAREKSTKSFLRKGQVGDWKNYFTVAQNEYFDKLYKEKMAGSGLDFRFED